MGLADWYSCFCANLIVKDGGTISNRYKRITRRLNTDFWGSSSESLHSLYVGSYGRGTAIGGLSDVDMMFRLPFAVYEKFNSYSGNGQSALIQTVRQSIEQTYSKTSIRGDGQVISVPFDDGITFEVVPVFVNDDESYTYPDANNGGRWLITNPKPEIAAFKNRNQLCNNNLVLLGRMGRAWRHEWNVPIGGLLIDTLAYQFIETWSNREKSHLYFDFMSRDFFNWMANQKEHQMYWKAPGSGQYVYGKEFQHKAKRCYNFALEAINYETSLPKREWSAKQKWREIYGKSFPD